MPSPLPPSRRWSRPYVFGVGIGLPLVVVGLALGISMLQDSRAIMADVPRRLTPAPIDGSRAYGYLKQICDLGPRPAGSAANTRQREMVAEHFKKCGGTVREQPFSAKDPLSRQNVAMVNLIGSWFPDRHDRVVIGAHYDTRPHPDREPDPSRRNEPFIGANDGASGVALLMEIANHLSESPTPWGVDLVLFDGEELVYDQTGEYFLGSNAFGRAYKADRRSGKSKVKYAAGFVLDMVGGRDLNIEQEQYSLSLAPRLVRDVWGVAQRLQATGFKNQRGQAVLDDHLSLNNNDIPAIDIIDFSYPQWHTADDRPEYCSGDSLAQVGRVLTAWLALPKPRRR